MPKHEISYSMDYLHKFPFFMWRNDRDPGEISIDPRQEVIESKIDEMFIVQNYATNLMVTKSFGLELCKV